MSFSPPLITIKFLVFSGKIKETNVISHTYALVAQEVLEFQFKFNFDQLEQKKKNLSSGLSSEHSYKSYNEKIMTEKVQSHNFG